MKYINEQPETGLGGRLSLNDRQLAELRFSLSSNDEFFLTHSIKHLLNRKKTAYIQYEMSKLVASAPHLPLWKTENLNHKIAMREILSGRILSVLFTMRMAKQPRELLEPRKLRIQSRDGIGVVLHSV